MSNSHKSRLWPGAALALGSALLFGIATPFSKLLIGGIDPQMLAGGALPRARPRPGRGAFWARCARHAGAGSAAEDRRPAMAGGGGVLRRHAGAAISHARHRPHR